VTFSGTNDYSGNTTVTNGILSITSTAALPGWNANNRYPISSGATLAVQDTVSDASIATILATTGNFASGSLIGFDLAAGDRTYAPDITGAIGVALVGLDVLTLSGSNSYSGPTRASSGTLKAGSSSAFAGTSQLQISGDAALDLNGFNASFASNTAASSFTTITSSAAGTGTDTLTITGGTTSFTGLIEDGATRKVAVRCSANNASNVPNNAWNTYSGGLTLLGTIAPATNGVRLIPFAAIADVDGNGNVLSGPYGTGAITIGESATDKVQLYFNAANRTISNNIIVNTAAGTDTVATFRIESIGHTINGAIQANLASAVFRNNVTGGSAGVGAITLTGPISTGGEPTAGLSAIAAGVNGLTLTLANASEVSNSYTGNTVITGANATLILGEANQIPNGIGKGNVVMTGSKLDLAGFDETINGLSGSGTIDNLTTGADNTLTLGDGDATSTAFSGSIANTVGELALDKVGSGIQTLTGFNTYTGPTTVNGGTLNINGALDSATVTVGGATATGSPTLSGTDGTINGTLLVAAAGGGAEGTINPRNRRHRRLTQRLGHHHRRHLRL
jgi:fibronectin-binding autotransporter adhesin